MGFPNFIQFLYEEAGGIKDYGHSLYCNSHEREELLNIVQTVTSCLERFDELIVESYGL